MTDFCQLLALSTDQYRDLYEKTKDIGDNLPTMNPETMLVRAEELEELKQEARKTDKTINEMITSDLISASSDIFHKRLSLMQRFLELNTTIALGIKAKMAVSRDELIRIKKGRTSISGYHSSSKNQTRLINESA